MTKGFYLGQKGMEVRALSRKKLVLRIVVAIVVAVALLHVVLFLFKDMLIFYPGKVIELTPAQTGWDFEDVYLTSANGARINCWYLPGLPENPRTVIILHGNGGNMENMLGRIITYHKLDYGVLAIDYQGYGRSGGSPTEERTYQDALAAWDFLVGQKGIEPSTITIHGFSLGGGVASYLALAKSGHKNPLVLDSTFTKAADVPATMNPLLGPTARIILGDAYDTLSRLKGISPRILLVLHSPEDDVVPYSLGQKLFESYDGGPKKFYGLEGRHLDYVFNQGVYAEAIYRDISEMAPLVMRLPPKPEEEGGPWTGPPEPFE
jgi:fermentation-respiration switch protein FrsA (DUF1100 family)